MPVFTSAIDPAAGTFRRNCEANSVLVDALRLRIAKAALGGPEPSREGREFG